MTTRPESLRHDEVRRLTGRDDAVILEIGSNDGADTAELLRYHPRAKIYCFDCEPRAIEKWKRRRHFGDRAQLFEVALDETEGEQLFWQSGGKPTPEYPEEWHMSGSLCRPTGHLAYSPWCKFSTQIRVATVPLDVWAETYLPDGTVDFMWIDVQGAEGRVFRGGKNVLSRTRYVKAEAHVGEMYEGQPTEAEMAALLSGWTCLGRYGDDLLWQNQKVSCSW